MKTNKEIKVNFGKKVFGKKVGGIIDLALEQTWITFSIIVGLIIVGWLIITFSSATGIAEIKATVDNNVVEETKLQGYDVVETVYLDKDINDASFTSAVAATAIKLTGTNIQSFTNEEVGVAMVGSNADVLLDTATVPNAVDGIGWDSYTLGSEVYSQKDVVITSKYIISAVELTGLKGVSQLVGTLTDNKVPFNIDESDVWAATEVGLYVYKIN